MSLEGGVDDVYFSQENVNGDVFEDFVRTTLLPILMPFNGTNSHSTVIKDNCSIHDIERVLEMITGVGALMRFLLPYRPDLSPIELFFQRSSHFGKLMIWLCKLHLVVVHWYQWH